MSETGSDDTNRHKNQTAGAKSAGTDKRSRRARERSLTAVLLVAVALVTCLSCLVGVLVARALRPASTLARPSRSSTPTPYPTQTPYPTHTPYTTCAACAPCPPTAAPYPTSTPLPCTTCPPTVTPTSTRKAAALPPTPTPTPANPTATAAPKYLFRVGLTAFLPPPNCDSNWFPLLEGRIVDASDVPVKGLRVQGVNSSGLVAPPSDPSGEMGYSTPHEGEWQHAVNFKYQLPGTYDGSTWTIFVIDKDNQQASEPFTWTLNPDCHNPAFVEFTAAIAQ
jgi:hypothetical protein